MKIAITCPGGAENPKTWSGTPYGIYTALKSQNHKVVSVDVSPPARLGSLYIRLLKLFKPSLRNISSESIRLTREYSYIFTFMAIMRLRSVDPDMVIQLGTGYAVGKQNFVTYEDMTIPQAIKNGWGEGWNKLTENHVKLRSELQKDQYRAASHVYMATTWAKESVCNDYGISPHKVTAIGIGQNQIQKSGISLHKDWSTPRFLFVGKDWERKNGSLVLKCFQALKEEFSEAELYLVGAHPLVEETGVIGCGELNLNNPHHQEKLSRLFQQATCLVVPSRFEPAGIVYVEAASYGIPSIGTQCGGASDLIGDGGVTVDPNDTDSLLSQMRKLCDPAIAQELGEKAKNHSQNFTWDAVARRLISRG